MVNRWGFFEDHMRVGPADAEGADPGTPRSSLALPVDTGSVDIERAVCEIDLWVGGAKMQARRDLLVLERQNGLDQARNACRGIQVADIGLYRSDGNCRSRLLFGSSLKSLHQRSD